MRQPKLFKFVSHNYQGSTNYASHGKWKEKLVKISSSSSHIYTNNIPIRVELGCS